MAIVFSAFVPFFWSIPIFTAFRELNSILPVQGGFTAGGALQSRRFLGLSVWLVELDRHIPAQQPLRRAGDGLPQRISPWITGNIKWAGACLVLCLLAYLKRARIQIAGWLSVALLVAVFIPVAWLCLVSLFHLALQPHAPFGPARSAVGRRSSEEAWPSPCGITPDTSSFPA